MCVRMLNAKRQSRLAAAAAEPENWWWSARTGRLDSMHLGLLPKSGGNLLAKVCVVGLDLYINAWKTRTIRISNLQVNEQHRRKGYGQLLLDEVAAS